MFINAEAAFLNKYVPGFENAVLRNVGRFVGIRDGRHPSGSMSSRLEDARTATAFPDAVTAPMTKTFYWDGHRRHTVRGPLSVFSAQGRSNNLMLTGASLSFTYETIFMVMRNFPWCTQTGEIAGYVAALSVGKEITPSSSIGRRPISDPVSDRRLFGSGVEGVEFKSFSSERGN